MRKIRTGDEVFVTTKVWHSDLRPDDLRRSVEASLRNLRLPQVDLILIHWPNADIPLAGTLKAGRSTTTSGLPRFSGHSAATRVLFASRGSAPSPRGAPASIQCTIVLVCWAVRP